MKKTVLLLLLVLIPVLGNAGEQQRKQNAELRTLVNQISASPGSEVVKLGSLSTGLLRRVIKAELANTDDPQERELLSSIMGIKRIAVIDYSSCTDALTSKFNRKIEKVLNDDNILIDIKDDEDNMKIYGFISDDGSSVTDFVLHSSTENTLNCLFGTFTLPNL